MSRPIFVVGSPRSGTSILTWCLGQHSNILAQEESDWLGRFALDLEAAYQNGTRRGERSQLGSLGVRRDEFFAAFGYTINELVLSHRHELTRNAREQALAAPDSSEVLPAFKTERLESDPKKRWVDGTPEYSFYIFALRKLFPEAVFIHIVRNVSAVVRSMLHFGSVEGPSLVESEQQAYDYWFRAVRACLLAERAYGPEVVHRLVHSDLIKRPERVFQPLFEFLGEPYEPACLEPLQSCINSSNVPAEFQLTDAKTDERMIDEVRQLERELMKGPAQPDPSALNELETEFKQRVHHNQNVNSYYRKTLARVQKLERELEAKRAVRHRRGWGAWLVRGKTSL